MRSVSKKHFDPMFPRTILLLAAGLFALFLHAQNEVNFNSLPPLEFKAVLESSKGLLLDVRTPEECSEGIIAGATLLDYSAPGFMEGIKKLDRDRPVYVYCASGGRSRQTMTRMKGLGFKEVHDLEGGIGAWTTSGQPVVKEGSGSKR
jgi:rhodanese-related sulfurtransferase